MNIAEFGRTVKAKHPEYEDIADAELGARVLNKYPEYKDMIDVQETSTTRRPTSFGTTDMPNAGPIIDEAAAMAKMLMPTTVKEGLEQGGGAIGEFMGGPFGAGVGGGAGNVLGQMFEQGAVPPIWTGGANYTPAIGSPNINWDETGNAAVLNAATAGVGKYGSRLAMKGIAPATKTIKPEAVAAEKFLEPYGGRMAAQQKTSGPLMDIAGNIADVGATGKGTMESFYQQYQTEPIKRAMADISQSLAKGKPIDAIDEAGIHLVEGLKGNRKAIGARLGQDFQKWDKMVGNNPTVDLSDSLKVFEEIVRKQPVNGSESGRIAQGFIDNLNQMETFERVGIEQSNLFELPSGTKQLIGDKDKANIIKMRHAFLKDIEKAAKEIEIPVEGGSTISNFQRRAIQTKTAADVIKELRQAYAKEMKPFNNRWVNQLVNTEGGTQVVSKVFNQKSPGLIVKVKEALGSQSKWEELQATWLNEKLTTKWIDDETKLFDYRKFVKEIDDMGASYNAIFDGSQRKAIDELINTIKVIEGRGRMGKAGAIWIQLKQASALSTLGGGVGFLTSEDKGTGAATGILGGAGVAIGSPYLFAKVFTNPAATRWLSRALKEGRYENVSELVAQLSRFTAVRAKYIVNEKSKQPPPSQ